jgi:hypothetical protein
LTKELKDLLVASDSNGQNRIGTDGNFPAVTG